MNTKHLQKPRAFNVSATSMSNASCNRIRSSQQRTEPLDLKLRLVRREIDDLHPNEKNTRRHGDKQIENLAASLRRFGFMVPVIVDRKGAIVAGHARVEAARRLGIREVPTISIDHLNDAEQRAFAIADNRIAELAEWQPELLAEEFKFLNSLDLDFDLEITGFDTAEIDVLLDQKSKQVVDDGADQIPNIEPERLAVTRLGDVWQLGRHRLVCGNALCRDTVRQLMGGEAAHLVFTDPPYNVRIPGNVTRSTHNRHSDFVMASGEMTEPQFVEFLRTALTNHNAFSVDGSIHFICIDWRHLYSLLSAGRGIFTEIKNICVWNKDRAGMGSFYRSKHELICVFKKGRAQHINNFELGQHGRYRTNVWDYASAGPTTAGANATRDDHPTVKPVAMVADAIKDCSKRGDIVLDGFAGSGTTIIAAEKTGRIARVIELDPIYVDVAVRRWEQFGGKPATLAETGETSSAVTRRRAASPTTADAAPTPRRGSRHG